MTQKAENFLRNKKWFHAIAIFNFEALCAGNEEKREKKEENSGKGKKIGKKRGGAPNSMDFSRRKKASHDQKDQNKNKKRKKKNLSCL